MPEPRRPIVRARVSTQALERASLRLASERYPVRLAVIDRELQRRAMERERRAA